MKIEKVNDRVIVTDELDYASSLLFSETPLISNYQGLIAETAHELTRDPRQDAFSVVHEAILAAMSPLCTVSYPLTIKTMAPCISFIDPHGKAKFVSEIHIPPESSLDIQMTHLAPGLVVFKSSGGAVVIITVPAVTEVSFYDGVELGVDGDYQFCDFKLKVDRLPLGEPTKATAELSYRDSERFDWFWNSQGGPRNRFHGRLLRVGFERNDIHIGNGIYYVKDLKDLVYLIRCHIPGSRLCLASGSGKLGDWRDPTDYVPWKNIKDIVKRLMNGEALVITIENENILNVTPAKFLMEKLQALV